MQFREFNKIETPPVLTKKLKTMKFLLKDSSGSLWTRFRKHSVIGKCQELTIVNVHSTQRRANE